MGTNEAAKKDSGDKKSRKVPKFLKTKKFWIPVIVIVAVIIAGVIILPGQKNTTAETESTTTITEATVETGTITNSISGTGSLEDDTSLSVDIPEGLAIAKIYVEAGDTVAEGDKLAKVSKSSVASLLLSVKDEISDLNDAIDDLDDYTDTSSDDYLNYLVYKEALNSLKETRTELKALLKDPVIYADTAGTIASVNISEGSSTSSGSGSSSDSSGVISSSSSSSSGTITATWLSASESDVTAVSLSSDSAALDTYTTSEDTTTSSDSSTDTSDSSDSTGTETSVISITQDMLTSLTIETPVAGNTPQVLLDDTDYYTASITWSKNTTFKAGKKYKATITLTSADGYAFTTADDYSDIAFASGVISDGYPKVTGGENTSGNKLVVKVTFTALSSSSSTSSDSTTDSSSTLSGSTDSSGSSSSSSSTSDSSSSSDSSSDDTTVSTDTIGSVEAFTLSSDASMIVTISVDEADINSVAEGQSATVTLDAMEDQSFDGEITAVTTSSSGDSGSVKYSVDVTIDKADGMLAGMTASAVINIEESENCLMIPSAAITEVDGETVVYTEQDSEGNLSGETVIETGLSNGTQVEVTSGLSEGDTIYYESTDSSSSALESIMGGSSDMDMSDFSGSMPSGGGDSAGGGASMPSGGGDSAGGGSMPSGGGQ